MNASSPPTASDQPLLSILLIAYNQEYVIGDAVRSLLAQQWKPLEIIMSDDCSSDGTFAAIEAAVHGYEGPHRLLVRRNEKNLGISAHLSFLATLASGELLFVAAGDDVSMHDRCSRVYAHWLAHNRCPDLIATDLVDIDNTGTGHGRIVHETLDDWRSFDDWAAKRPHLIGAAHTWTRRLFERFGPMQPGSAAEDQIMTFRAIVSGGATTLHEPLVRYRRGGLSSKQRYRSVTGFLARKRQNNHFELAEIRQLQHDADLVGLGERMRAILAVQFAREHFIEAMFAARSLSARFALAAGSHDIKFGLKIRMLLYTCCPVVYAPILWAKRTFRQR